MLLQALNVALLELSIYNNAVDHILHIPFKRAFEQVFSLLPVKFQLVAVHIVLYIFDVDAEVATLELVLTHLARRSPRNSTCPKCPGTC